MKIATWNVNSVKARKDRLLGVLARHAPDVLCVQELKAEDSAFPWDDVRAAGYHAAVYGQRTYNGVAILTRTELSDVRRSFEDGIDDTHARVISGTLAGIRVINLYVPNGGEVGSDKWLYKLAWLARLRTYIAQHHTTQQPLVICGDLNIAPAEIDVARPGEWENTVLFRPEMRVEFQKLIDWGLTDVFRKHNADGGLYSWWDYRMLGFPKNNGLRIDHVLATLPLARTSTGASIDREERKGQSPSDHAPVIASFEL